MKPKLKAPGTKRLRLQYDVPLSNFALNYDLRRYSVALEQPRPAAKPAPPLRRTLLGGGEEEAAGSRAADRAAARSGKNASQLCHALADFGCTINLFNMLPIGWAVQVDPDLTA